MRSDFQPIASWMSWRSLPLSRDRERFLAAGFDGYLPKPIDIRTLRDQVRTFIERGLNTPKYIVMDTAERSENGVPVSFTTTYLPLHQQALGHRLARGRGLWRAV
jgi:DNA-binding response OmpR family regulator